jgi:hypothetical protein
MQTLAGADPKTKITPLFDCARAVVYHTKQNNLPPGVLERAGLEIAQILLGLGGKPPRKSFMQFPKL